MNLIDANKPRAILIATIIAARLGENAGQWKGYTVDEGLDGVLVKDNLLRYARPGHDHDPNYAVLFFTDPQLINTETVDWGEERTVEKDVVERYKSTIEKIKGVEYTDKLEHTFSKTTTMQEAFKVGAELAVKTYFEAGAEGIKGGAEVSAKLSAEYSRQWGSQETHSDTVERTVDIPVDSEGVFVYEAVRSTDKMQREISAKSDMDYRINFVSSPDIPFPDNRPLFDYGWLSVQQFIDVGNGQAAADKAMYAEFMADPLTNDEVDKIKDLGFQTVHFEINYDNVTSQEIRITR